MSSIPPYPQMPACDCVGKCIGHNYENHDGERGGCVYYQDSPSRAFLFILALCAVVAVCLLSLLVRQ